jgi:hypothetical protein
VAALCLLGSGPAAAADPSPRSTSTLAVSPIRLEIPTAELAGPHYFELTNRGPVAIDISVGMRDFVTAEDGSVLFRDAAPYSASRWVSATPNRLRVKAGRTAKVAVRIRVPADAEPGDHQVVVVFTAQSRGAASGVRIRRGVGAPVVFAVPGATDPSVRVLGLRAPRFALGGPLSFTAALRSTGTVHRTFDEAHRLAVEVDGGRITFEEFMVLRGATRTVTTTWDDPPLICFCRAVVALRLPDGTVSRADAKVVIFPLHLVVAALVVAAVVTWVVRLRRRRYRADVLAAARALNRDGAK